MRRLRMLPAARSDLVRIFDYVARESGSAAVGRAFVEKLRGKCHDLAGLPGTLGRARPELRPDVRSFAFRGYVIFFRYQPAVLEVVNIIEGRRDIDALTRGEDGLE